jgi:hypothetical protein
LFSKMQVLGGTKNNFSKAVKIYGSLDVNETCVSCIEHI